MNKLGYNLKCRREAVGLDQQELAERVGSSQSIISYIEKGIKIPSVALLTAIADVRDCSIDMLLGRR